MIVYCIKDVIIDEKIYLKAGKTYNAHKWGDGFCIICNEFGNLHTITKAYGEEYFSDRLSLHVEKMKCGYSA